MAEGGEQGDESLWDSVKEHLSAHWTAYGLAVAASASASALSYWAYYKYNIAQLALLPDYNAEEGERRLVAFAAANPSLRLRILDLDGMPTPHLAHRIPLCFASKISALYYLLIVMECI